MRKDVVFRGCTRPAMFLGVPYLPFAAAAGTCLLLTFYIDMFFLALLPVVILVMRQMARRDEMIFRLLALRWAFRLRVRGGCRGDGLWSFSASRYRARLHDGGPAP